MLKNSDFKEWIEMCVKLNHINSFDYNEFTEQHLIGEGRFAFVKSAMMKCDVKVALKSLKVDVILEKSIIEEFVNEVDNRYGQYIMVLQFADSGNLRNYLDDSFTKLTWSDKFRMANAISKISSDDETSSDEENDISLDGSDIDSSTSDDCDDKENMINILNDLVQLYTNMCQLGSSESDRSYENWFGNNISKSRRFFDFLKKNAEIVKHHEFILGKFYQRGFGVRQNNPKYFKWMERGTRKDDKLAYFELSKCYFFGKGVKKDNEKAYELYNRSNRI
ncbi:14278_t:CDS:2 [Funneliformis geosporum]|uniref:14278_t:CDS:1 n=1 Tax=Funneliformis geosporum TaxID=1117311 RepID=A0A9W4SDQ7_9GLOM|nr:14278_t:CDS:2 [Funneliformis geosporum]